MVTSFRESLLPAKCTSGPRSQLALADASPRLRCAFPLPHAVVGDDPEFGAVAPALAVGEPELVEVGEHLGDAELGVAGGLGLADVLGEQVDQDDAAEVGGGGLELDRDAVEHPLGQAVVLPPAPREAVAVFLVLDEGPGRARDLERPLLPAQHEPDDGY